jgi:hypothetical protein
MLMTFRSINVIAIAFPIIVKACIPIRMYLLPKIFTEEQLCLLDAEDEDIDRLVAYYERRERLKRGQATMEIDDVEIDDVKSESGSV